ncbi:hypothetical protein LRS07_17445 [Aquabacterium sp. J223]|nr:hypothetical protein [Aquabacterium sp. J223]UUX95010.1 hypothetical protein LRS07_17445 [Aquabacterium sp. J223]
MPASRCSSVAAKWVTVAGAGMAMLTLPGCAFARLTRSGSVFSPLPGCATKTFAASASRVTATRSCAGSKGSVANDGRMVRLPTPATSSVWPSGAALATLSQAMMEPPPGRLSTMNC